MSWSICIDSDIVEGICKHLYGCCMAGKVVMYV